MKQKATLDKIQLLVGLLFAGFVAWWLTIYFTDTPDHTGTANQLFAATYGSVALLGGLIGISASKAWGLHKSLIGRAVLFFSLGLLAQELGQVIYSFYLYALHVQIPYPSFGDIGYFGSVVLYIYASLQLLKATGARFSLKDRSKQIIAVILPLLLLSASYAYFLNDYHFDFSSPQAALTVLLDLGYPLGQAAYIAIALLTYLLSRDLLGGIMKRKVLFILFALLMQYIADFTFLNAANNETMYPGGANDLMYLIAYVAMALALSTFRRPSLPKTAARGND